MRDSFTLPARLTSDVARVLFGPWPLRPLMIGTILAVIYQYAATDSDETQFLQTAVIAERLPFSILRAAVVVLPMWIAVSVWRRRTNDAPLTRGMYLAITVLTGCIGGAIRFTMTDGELPEDLRALAYLLTRGTIQLMIVQLVLGLADARLRGQVRRADEAVAEVELQRRVILETEERVRSRVSRLLHDRVQAGLVVVGMQLRQIQSDVAGVDSARLTAVMESIERLRRDDVRQASRELSPDIQTIGLRQALEELAGRYEPAMHVEVAIDPMASGDLSGFQASVIDEDVLLGIYRIVEQSLLNAGAHGHATSMHLAIGMTEDTLTVDISDNGSGFSAETVERGSGLTIIDAWTARLGGEMVLSSVPGAGTRIRCALPATTH